MEVGSDSPADLIDSSVVVTAGSRAGDSIGTKGRDSRRAPDSTDAAAADSLLALDSGPDIRPVDSRPGILRLRAVVVAAVDSLVADMEDRDSGILTECPAVAVALVAGMELLVAGDKFPGTGVGAADVLELVVPGTDREAAVAAGTAVGPEAGMDSRGVRVAAGGMTVAVVAADFAG